MRVYVKLVGDPLKAPAAYETLSYLRRTGASPRPGHAGLIPAVTGKEEGHERFAEALQLDPLQEIAAFNLAR